MDRGPLELSTDRLWIQVPAVHAAAAIQRFCVTNREHLTPWEPPRQREYFSTAYWRRQIIGSQDEFLGGHGVRTVLREKSRSLYDQGRSGPVIGVLNLTQIIRGAFQAGVIGYSLDQHHLGKGLMGEALEGMLDYAFGEMGLHRLMANYRPENHRSAAVLERLGFEREGYAKDYLFIDGAWRDHVLTSLAAPTWAATKEKARIGPGHQGHADAPFIAGPYARANARAGG